MDPAILVVDDEPGIRTLITRVLTRGGYRVREAGDGEQALAQITVERPDLVLSDLMMPGMRGDELITQLMHRRDPIPCILMSAYQVDAGPLNVPFLGKPFALETLLNVVGGVVQEQPCLSA